MPSVFDPTRRYTVEEYFELEALSDVKHEYRDGLVYDLGNPPPPRDLPGGEERRSRIRQNLAKLLGDRSRAERLVIETYSPTTEGSARSEKFHGCIADHRVDEYVLVAQDWPHIETFQRQSNGDWLWRYFEDIGGCAKLRTLSIDLPLVDVYVGVDFPEGEGTAHAT